MPDRLASLIRERQPCVVLTGAGISTESGIPDFRSPIGIWATVDPMEFASLSAFRRDPEHVWSFYRLRIEMLTEAEPNRGHLALAELERRGFVAGLVTQNIDMLHERAGTKRLVEVHGSIRTATCPSCRESLTLAAVQEQLTASEGAPRCPGCSDILKPDVVFFEEMLPPAAIDEAHAWVESAELLIVVGSALEVYPVAGLPDHARKHGGAVAIVNLGPTTFDRASVLKLELGAGETFDAVLAELDAS